MSKPCPACYGQGVVYVALNPWFPTAPSLSMPCKECGGTRTAEPLPVASSGTATVVGLGQGGPPGAASALTSALEASSGRRRSPHVTAYLSAIGAAGGRASGESRRADRAKAEAGELDPATTERIRLRSELALRAARARWARKG